MDMTRESSLFMQKLFFDVSLEPLFPYSRFGLDEDREGFRIGDSYFGKYERKFGLVLPLENSGKNIEAVVISPVEAEFFLDVMGVDSDRALKGVGIRGYRQDSKWLSNNPQNVVAVAPINPVIKYLNDSEQLLDYFLRRNAKNRFLTDENLIKKLPKIDDALEKYDSIPSWGEKDRFFKKMPEIDYGRIIIDKHGEEIAHWSHVKEKAEVQSEKFSFATPSGRRVEEIDPYGRKKIAGLSNIIPFEKGY